MRKNKTLSSHSALPNKVAFSFRSCTNYILYINSRISIAKLQMANNWPLAHSGNRVMKRVFRCLQPTRILIRVVFAGEKWL